MQLVRSDADVVDEDLSEVRVVEAHEQIQNGLLAGPRLSNDAHVSLWFDHEADAPKHELVLLVWVPEPHVLELNLTLHLCSILEVPIFIHSNGIDLGLVLQNLEDPLRRSQRFLVIWPEETGSARAQRTEHATEDGDVGLVGVDREAVVVLVEVILGEPDANVEEVGERGDEATFGESEEEADAKIRSIGTHRVLFEDGMVLLNQLVGESKRLRGLIVDDHFLCIVDSLLGVFVRVHNDASLVPPHHVGSEDENRISRDAVHEEVTLFIEAKSDCRRNSGGTLYDRSHHFKTGAIQDFDIIFQDVCQLIRGVSRLIKESNMLLENTSVDPRSHFEGQAHGQDAVGVETDRNEQAEDQADDADVEALFG